jgi:hypothetical protein
VAHDDWQKRHPWGEDGRVDPDDIGREDEEEAAGSDAPSRGLVTRALSILPFLLVAAFGLIGIVGWLFIVLLGVGTSEPIWKTVQGLSVAQVLWQLALAVLVGVVPVIFVLAASWATAHGFGEDSGRTFWAVTQALWGLAAVGLVVIDRARHAWLSDLGLSALDWWFLFGMVAFAVIMAGVRLRRAPGSVLRR